MRAQLMNHLPALVMSIVCVVPVPVAAQEYTEIPIREVDREHWSFRPLSPVAVPDSPDRGSSHNEIDHFIAVRLKSDGLQIQPQASRGDLLRRVTLDLTGLLPSSEQIHQFVGEDAPESYEDVVDRLLDSSAYGERWAQQWLDLARFAETDGFEHDIVRPEAWRYRDWVIAALNRDVPYDQFVRLQIAGDLIEPGNSAAIVATQFCLSGPDMPDINSQDERRHTLLNEMTSTVGEVFLGLQLGCAQCHDHKYDPISQADFYRLRAIFEPAVHVKKNAPIRTLQETQGETLGSHVMLRGDFRRPGPIVSPGVPRVLEMPQAGVPNAFEDAAIPSRLALAKWITSEHHPLTARVIVNRVWQGHFGIGLSESSSDFGVMGHEPVHGSLLDWLAVWFMENGWSLKKLHRLIVTSATYRQRSYLDTDADSEQLAAWRESLNVDPQARLLSRFPRQRLSGETIRDIMLQAAGDLNRKSGGPGVRPPLPEELRKTLLKDQWVVTEDRSEHQRRSIYVFARRNLKFPIFDVFDRPSADTSCPQRFVSTTAPQSLHLMNSEFSLSVSKRLAKRIGEHTADRATRIREVADAILGRELTEEELAEMTAFVAESKDDSSGLVNLCLVLFNSNEFVFVD